jgi:tRNA A-37 threonylcarbamoyl transferase component Bud32
MIEIPKANFENESFYESGIYDMIEMLPTGNKRKQIWRKKIEEEDLTLEQLKKLYFEIKDFIAALPGKKQENIFLEKNQHHFFDHDPDALLEKETAEEVHLIAEEARDRAKNIIGQGKTATVYICERNPKYCYKIITNPEEYAKGNNVGIEARFLNELDGRNTAGAKVPKVTYYLMDKKVHIIIMEYLDAVTLKSIFDGEEDLPEEFEFERDFGSLERFIESMHQKKILHRDLHSENIMIDRLTGQMYVIDFGKSKYGMNQKEDYLDKSGLSDDGTFYISDDVAVSEFRGRLRKEFRKNA